MAASFIKNGAEVVRPKPDGRGSERVKVLAPYIAQLFKLLYDMACIPACWKQAKLSPLYKKGPFLDPNTHNNKQATYHSWFAIPFSRKERMPINVPRYLHLDLSKRVMRSVSRFRLRAHTLKVEVAAWLEDGSRICDQCPE